MLLGSTTCIPMPTIEPNRYSRWSSVTLTLAQNRKSQSQKYRLERSRRSKERDSAMRCRKDYRDLTADERSRFVAALYHVKSTGIVDQFAQEHEDFFHDAHHSSFFLPWHREFLRRFEDALRSFDSKVTIPYWNSVEDQETD